MNKTNKCGICFNEIPDNKKVFFPCFHWFCDQCTLETFRAGIKTCPTCKTDATVLINEVNEYKSIFGENKDPPQETPIDELLSHFNSRSNQDPLNSIFSSIIPIMVRTLLPPQQIRQPQYENQPSIRTITQTNPLGNIRITSINQTSKLIHRGLIELANL